MVATPPQFAPRTGPIMPKAKDLEEHFAGSPLFMTQLPEEEESSDAFQALQALAFEGSPNEVAKNFKQQGNEYFQGRRFRDALGFYTQGVDAKPDDPSVMETLLTNRAACNLALENNRQVLLDCAQALKLNPKSLKAFYRSSLALLGMERFVEAIDCCEHALRLEGQADNKSILDVKEKATTRKTKKEQREGEAAERTRRKQLSKKALDEAFQVRGLVIRKSSSPPDNPSPAHFDDDVIPECSLPSVPLWPHPTSWAPPPPSCPVIFPVFLMYPEASTSDLLSSFATTDTFADQLAPVFASPPEWDTTGAYSSLASIVIYCETAKGRLLKIPHKMTLEEVFAAGKRAKDNDDGVVLRDGCLSFVVLAKGESEKKWVEEAKRKRDAGSSSA